MSRLRISRETLEGIIPALVTPFTPNDEVDEAALRKLIRYVLENGVHGVMTTGGNGEFPHLLREERMKVLEVTVDEVDGRVPVIACTSACSVKEAVLLGKHAEDSGADALILVPPYYFKLPEESILDFYKRIAEQVTLPIVVYNNPAYTGHNIGPALMERLAEIPGVVGLKQSNPDLSQTLEIIRSLGNRISVLTGIDSQLFPVLSIGGRGVFSTAACVIPKQMVEVYEAFRRKEFEKALRLHMRIQVLNRFFEYEPGYVAPCKEALSMIGLPCGAVRAPLPPLKEKERKELREALKYVELIS
ncbi:MAG: 4-hydroxy-tetrahydrodipicolinate synthase [Candidatus Bathyarchaeia archaeon]